MRNKQNQGKGFSILKGFKYAQENDFTHAVTLDADSQHDPRLIEMFLEVNKDISLVLGTRIFRKDMPYHRIISNKLTSLIISFLESRKVPVFFWILIFIVIVFQPLLIGATIGLGIFDIWMDMRKVRKNTVGVTE